MEKYDVTVIGSGPGGYVCALRCAQLGMKTALVERYSTLGGTCLNVGCIPSKALLDSSEKFYELTHHFAEHGIVANKVELQFSQMSKRVQDVVKQTCDGINFLMKKNKITVLQGHAQLQDAHTIVVQPLQEGAKSITISSQKIVLATGSKPSTLPGVTIDKERIITSTEALRLKNPPKELLVIGGGVIGLELGSAYARLGSKVTVIEYAPSLIPTMDQQLGKELLRVLKKQGINFSLGAAVQKVQRNGEMVTVTALDADKKELRYQGDYCLMAVGRRPYTDNLGLDKAGISLDERKRIPVNEHCETVVPGIFAIGDVVRGPMLAHKAEDEGVLVAEFMNGQKPHIDYLLIPGVIYTWPEVASVGHSEENLKEKQIPYKVGNFPFKASGRARASNESDGFVKVLAHKTTDEILGVHMIGPRAADMIAQAVTAMEYKASAEDIARICHPHPTYTEAFKEACLAATENRALHI